MGPFFKPPFQQFHVSPVGTVPKDENKRRTIHHLSAPRKGISVNSEILQEDKTVTFIQFKEVVTWAQSLGKNSFIWKSDLENAYRQLALHPSAYPLLGIKWLGKYVFDTRGPFGLASMVSIFQDFGDLLQFAIYNANKTTFSLHGPFCLNHLLDDFFAGHPNYTIAIQQYQNFFTTCAELGVKVSIRKSFEPSQQLVILGFDYNTQTQTVSIPKKKIQKIKQQLLQLYGKYKTQAKTLLSIVGKLRWVANIIVVGNAFVRRLEQTAHSVNQIHFWVKLNKEAKRDIKWWLDVLNDETLNQRTFESILANPQSAEFVVSTDASTTMGMGGYNHKNKHAFQILNSNIPNLTDSHDIQFLELFALVLAAATWGHTWYASSVTFLCDNLPVVFMVSKKRASFDRPDLMQLIRILCKLANQHSFYFWIEHISTENNKTADSLSRFKITPDTTQNMNFESENNILINANNLLQNIF